jgi:hypothetical protein
MGNRSDPNSSAMEATAYFGYGGFNACPARWSMSLMLENGQPDSGPASVSLRPATMDFEVTYPITSCEDAAAMAKVHEYYCCDIADGHKPTQADA